MFGAMFIGLSGMGAYSNALRQVSNNITNLNSIGYRGSTVGFRDLVREGTGSVYYAQDQSHRGNGVVLDAQRIDFSQGELRQSGRDLDLAIDGDGFLVLEKDGALFYTRTGSFEIDENGYIVLSGTEYRLTLLAPNGKTEALSIDPYRTNAPTATTRVQFANNLSSTADDHSITNLEIFNAEGEAANWSVEFSRDEAAPAGEWTVTVTDSDGAEVGSQMLRFIAGILDPSTAELSFEDAASGHSAVFDFSENVTSFSSGTISTLRSGEIDGYGLGEITRMSMSETGILEIGYSNEQVHELGSVTLAAFNNEQALEQRSGGLFTYNAASGAELFTSDDPRVGRILSGRLEASNINLSAQFGDLILVQRGYQASSQVVSVSNDMIQQLFGIRGQG